MGFTPYAQTPGRRAVQVLGDLLFLAWVVGWVTVGLAVHRATIALAEPGRRLEAGATGVADHLQDAGQRAGDVPFAGDELALPFSSAGDAASAIADAGRRQVEAVTDLALLLGVVVAAVPVLLAVLLWLPPRIRFTRRATATRRFVESGADLRLFALRALAHQPVHRLGRVTADPLRAFEAADPDAVQRMARLELADAGLRLPLRGSRS